MERGFSSARMGAVSFTALPYVGMSPGNVGIDSCVLVCILV